ncbi:glycosyltransferase [Leuconostoc falkenbergense]|uniref:glycosyltransferase n=1 Tax=Leuconostoc falkenbergense TaxID=2766470 RepID=UPI0024AE3F2B|nr:glycosyltransferase [Leuconostoc falkenbergense]MDI6667901.1 glycosyltransferase [Leuconostoc falkenbergense]
MKIEIINSLSITQLDGIAWQIEQVKLGHSDELWVATPHEDAVYLIKKMGLPPDKVFDMYGQQYFSTIDEAKGIWWSDLTVPNESQIIINQDGTKSVMSFGRELAKVRWFSHSKRLVQAVTWYDGDGKIDYKDIYRRDGRLFAKQYFSEGELLQSDFYLGNNKVVVQDFYADGHCNLVVAFGQKFRRQSDYIADVGNQYVNNQYNVTQFGRSIDFAPQKTKLTLFSDVTDKNGRILKEVSAILKNKHHPIEAIWVKPQDAITLKMSGLPGQKVHVINHEPKK